MKNFTDFMIDVANDKKLSRELAGKLHAGNHAELSAWVKKKGYHVDEKEFKNLHEKKDSFKKKSAVGFYY